MLTLLGSLLLLPALAHAHGRMLTPPPRSLSGQDNPDYLRNPLPRTFNGADQSTMYTCGGINKPTSPSYTYVQAGQKLSVGFEMGYWTGAALHQGHVEVSLSTNGDSGPFVSLNKISLVGLSTTAATPHSIDVTLPSDLTCNAVGGCTLQWKWTGSVTSEVFINCADLQVGTSGSSLPAVSVPIHSSVASNSALAYATTTVPSSPVLTTPSESCTLSTYTRTVTLAPATTDPSNSTTAESSSTSIYLPIATIPLSTSSPTSEGDVVTPVETSTAIPTETPVHSYPTLPEDDEEGSCSIVHNVTSVIYVTTTVSASTTSTSTTSTSTTSTSTTSASTPHSADVSTTDSSSTTTGTTSSSSTPCSTTKSTASSDQASVSTTTSSSTTTKSTTTPPSSYGYM